MANTPKTKKSTDDFMSETYANLYGPDKVSKKMMLGTRGRYVVDTEGSQDYKTSKATNKALSQSQKSAKEAAAMRKAKGITQSLSKPATKPKQSKRKPDVKGR